jgi:hypothetical protein
MTSYTRPVHFKHSHWWKKRSWSKFASHYAWGTNGVYKWMQGGSLHGFLYGNQWIMFYGHFSYLKEPPLGGRSNTNLGDLSTPNTHNCWFVLFYHAWGPMWIGIHWISIWLRDRLHMTSHYTWGSVTTPLEFGNVLGRPLDTFLRALTISWSRLLACVWSGLYARSHERGKDVVFFKDDIYQ